MHALTPDTLDALLDAAWIGDRAALRAHIEAYLTTLGPDLQDRRDSWAERLSVALPPPLTALGTYRYAGQTAQAYEANGTQGLILASGRSAPDAFWRMRDPDQPQGFADYTWRHCDLQARLENNTEATLYVCADGTRYLDHAPDTLGLERLA